MSAEPVYGSSEHYLGQSGEAYFSYQNGTAGLGASLNAKKFRAAIAPQDTVVDFGCGNGLLLSSLHCGRRIGVEINPAARGEAVLAGIECVAALAELDSETADVCISNHALEHVPNPIGVLKEVHRVLKPGGKVVVVVPIDDWRTQKRCAANDVNRHLYTWSPQLFFNCLVESGFDPSEIKVGILTQAWFPGTFKIAHRIPESLFDAACTAFAFVMKRRELRAVARKR